MSSFGRDLKRRVGEALGKGEAWGDVNPLIVIGLTEAMLDLGLNEEQMYKIVRSYVKQLAAQVHTDKQAGNVSEDRQRNIFQAFEVLDSRENFSRALSEFRSMKSWERKELKILREAHTAVRGKLTELQSKEAEFTRGLRQLERDRDAFNRDEAAIRGKIPVLNAEIQDLYRKNTLHARREDEWRQRAKSYKAYIHSLSARERDLDAVHAFDARWVAVASLVPTSESYGRKPPAFAFNRFNMVSQKFQETARFIGMSRSELKEVVAMWRQHARQLKTRKIALGRDTLALCLSILRLSAGKPEVAFGWEKPFRHGRVIGSVYGDKLAVGRQQLEANLSDDSIFRNLNANLTPEGLLVLQTTVKSQTYLSGQTLRSMRLDTKHFILGAG
jgi:hypothetical protein